MIGYIIWDIISRDKQTLTLLPKDSGIGYEIYVPGSLLMETTSHKELFIYDHRTERDRKLFGFESMEQKRVFLHLLKVSGLGPKGALSMIEIGVSRILTALEEADHKVLSEAQGVGPKLAKKIIVELKGKIEILEDDIENKKDRDRKKIIKSLSGMGYAVANIEDIYKTIPKDIDTLEGKTLFCIKNLSK